MGDGGGSESAGEVVVTESGEGPQGGRTPSSAAGEGPGDEGEDGEDETLIFPSRRRNVARKAPVGG